MSNIRFRPVRKTDYPAIRALFNETWRFDRFLHAPRTCDVFLRIYLQQNLLESTWGLVAERDGAFLGIVLGAVRGDRPLEGRILPVLRLVFQSLRLIRCPRQDRINLREYRKVFLQYHRLLERCGRNRFDGELSFLAVSPDTRGTGLGRQLMERLQCHLVRRDVRSAYLFTDSWCNVGFYDRLGYTRLEEEEITVRLDGEPERITTWLYAFEPACDPADMVE